MIFLLAMGITLFAASASRAQSSKIPLVGHLGAVTRADIDAAIAATFPLENISFIRVVDRSTIELHHEPRGERCEHYDDMKRKKGRWVYRTTVVVIEGCGYPHI
jgi:hypothetical protein